MGISRLSRIFFLLYVGWTASAQTTTPVIGGSCKLGAADVNIGGKQTQFFLHCEPDGSSSGEGVWVVKSRMAQAPSPVQQIATPSFTVAPSKAFGFGDDLSQTKKKLPTSPIICEQNLSAREGLPCDVPETCLQQSFPDLNAYLQCNPATRKWHKKHCQQGFAFNFEHQSCIGNPKSFRQHVSRQPMNNGGLVCTYSQCSPSNPCSTGTCNNGYCCASASPSIAGSIHTFRFPTNRYSNTSNDDWTEKSADSCAAGFTSTLRCPAFGHCPPGLFCDSNAKLCCPLLLPLTEMIPSTSKASSLRFRHFPKPQRLTTNSPIPIDETKSSKQRRSMHSYPCVGCNSFFSYACPNGAQPYGRCAGGMCASGYHCMPATNLCCPIKPQYSACPGGGSSGGSCVSGQCGPGYACNSGSNMCCAQVVPATVCPDGTQAAGACVNNQCGMGFMCNQGLCCTNSSQTPRCLDGSQAIGACMQGRCGTGYTCTTGNICCPSTLNACPNGQTSIGTCVNGKCPDGYTCINNQCCGPPPSTQTAGSSPIRCERQESSGPCLNDQTCPEQGYMCDTENNWCCPQIMGNAVGPCITGAGGTRLCPEGYACSGPGVGQCFRLNTGTCAPEDQFGPCGENEPKCPADYTCIQDFCCKNGSFRRRKRSFLLGFL